MTQWKHGEPGPQCCCGSQITFVSVEGNVIRLVCMYHFIDDPDPKYKEIMTAFFPLPKERPDNWPNLTDDEMQALIDKAKSE